MQNPAHVELPNADTPAFPTTADTQFPGLSKREFLAAAIFKAQIPYADCPINQLARNSILFADALLQALEEPLDQVVSGHDDTEHDF